MKTTLVTCSFNRSEQARWGIRSVLQQGFNGGVIPDEIIFIDDGSVDDTKATASWLESFAQLMSLPTKFRYIYLDHPEPRISCIPRNIGIKEATGDVIIFTESECLHVGNTIEQLLNKMNDPKVVPVATQVWTMGRNIQEKLTEDYFNRPASILSHPYAQLTDNANMNNTKAPNSDYAITGSNNCITGCLFAVRKEDLLAVGGFDEEFEGHGWDDWDLFERLGRYGKDLEYSNDIAVIHQWHRKDYPYNIYNAAEKNGAISAKRKGYVANKDKEWGKYEVL